MANGFFYICYMRIRKIGIYTSGGDSPGMNAAIRAAVRTATRNNIEVTGIVRGYTGMIEGDFIPLESTSVANILQKGGTILKSSRCAQFLTKEGRTLAYANLKKEGIDALVCIGGNGSYAGALKINEEFGIPCIGIPGTIDNDLYGTDYTIGFHTAVQNAVEAIDKIRDTAASHDRTFFIEVMGRDSGILAMHIGLCVGAEAILIPELKQDLNYLYKTFEKRRNNKGFSIVVIAEGDDAGNASEIAHQFKQKFPNTEEKVTVLGHIQRGGSPVPQDRVLATRLGNGAVLELLKGTDNGALGVINNEVVLSSFEEAIVNHKKAVTAMWDLASAVS